MPSFLPKENPSGNISYVIHDVCKPFPADMQGSFNFAHVRYVLAGTAKVGIEAAVQNVVGTLEPGGWLQVQDLDTALDAPGYTTAIRDLMFVTNKLFEKIGVGNFVSRLGDVFKGAGLENVSVRRVELFIGRKEPNEVEAANSIDFLKTTINSVITAAVSK